MRIAFTHNVKRTSHESEAEFDTLETVRRITDTLHSLGHEVHPIDVAGPVSRLVARLETLRPDLVFNTAEGSHGRYREAFYPALFEQLGLPYTGSNAYVCGLTLDKQMTKMIVRRAGVLTPEWAHFDADHRPSGQPLGLRFPLIVKPNFEGSSKGVTRDSVVYSERELEARIDTMIARYGTGVLVEEFVVGRDVTVPYLEEVGVLHPACYRFDVEGTEPGFEVYDYALKNEESDRVHVEMPAQLPDEVTAKLRSLTATVMKTLDIRDLGRADFRLAASGEIYFIEVNALPSLEPGSSLYEAARLRGLGTDADVLRVVLASATRRQGVMPLSPRSAGSLRVGLAHNVRRIDPSTGDDEDAEFDSPETISAIVSAIEGFGHEVVLLEATGELPRLVGDLDLDVVFNIAEGLRGRTREAQVPALLELLDIPYTGSDAAALAVTLDKGLAKRLVREAGFRTARWRLVHMDRPAPTDLRFPLIVKPNAEGSSKGVTDASVARDQEALERAVAELQRRYRAPVLVEEFLPGREFTLGLLGDDEPQVLPIMEIRFDAARGPLAIYGYLDKVSQHSGVAFQVPADIDDDLATRLREVARGCFEALGCRDVARIDLRLDVDGEPAFIECNPLPGLSPGFSDLCVIAAAAGMDYPALIGAILAPAVRRWTATTESEEL